VHVFPDGKVTDPLPLCDQVIVSPEIVPYAPEIVAAQLVEEPALIADARQVTDVPVVAAATVKLTQDEVCPVESRDLAV
jgi:hypothetical protein